MNRLGGNLVKLFDDYISLEKEIQKLIFPISQFFCRKCLGNCCREEICKESIESTFLSILTEKQRIRFDNQIGWLGPLGCRLDYGRPLVCYEFFCEDILKTYFFKASNIKKIINDFVSIGNKAYGNTHLLCVDNLDILSSNKIDKIIYEIALLLNNMTEIHFYTNTIKSRYHSNQTYLYTL
jgi:hypothetical protein